MDFRNGKRDAVLCGLLAFVVFAFTAFPGPTGRVYPGDSALHQYFAHILGPWNSPWHPLYYTLAWLWLKLPLPGSVADQVTLFSGFMGAIAVGLAYLLALELTGRRGAAALAALTLAFGTIFWSQATEAEVYTTEMCFMLGTLLLLFRWQASRKDRDLILACFVYTQGFGVHLQMIALLPVFLAAVLITDRQVFRRPRLLAAVALCILAGLAPYAVCYFKDWPNELLAWGAGRDRTFLEYINTILGDGFQAWAFDYDVAEILTDRIPHFFWMWNREWMLVGLFLTAIGTVALYRKDPRRAFLLSIAALSLALFGMNYRVPDSEVFVLPTWPFLVPFVAAGIAALLDCAGDRWQRGRRAVGLSLCLALYFKVRFTYPSLAEDHTPYEPMRRAIAAVEPGSVVVNSIGPFFTQEALNYLYFAEKNLWGKGTEFLLPKAALGKEARRRTGNPDVVVPAAQARRAPFYVRQVPDSIAAHCLPRMMDTGLDDIVKNMRDKDFLVVARGPGGITNPSDAYALSKVGLLKAPRTGLYAGVGCKGNDCVHLEIVGNRNRAGAQREFDTSSHVVFVPEERSDPTHYSPIDIEIRWSMGNPYPTVTIDGVDPFLHYQRPIRTGLPGRYRSMDGRDFHEISSFDVGAASLALVLDGETGEVRQRYWQAATSIVGDPFTVFSFDRVGSLCRSVPRSFDTGGVVDFGDPSARAYMGGTFIADYNGPDGSSSAPVGSDVRIFVPFDAPNGPYKMTVRARSNPQMSLDALTDVSVNGKLLGAVTFRNWETRTLDIPDGLLRPGTNEIKLHFPELKRHIWGGPRRIRRKELSIAIDALRLTPVTPSARTVADFLSPEETMTGFTSIVLQDSVMGWKLVKDATINLLHEPGHRPTSLFIWARRPLSHPGQVLRVVLNGTELGLLAPETYLKQFRFDTPKSALSPGTNLLSLVPVKTTGVIPEEDPVVELQRVELFSAASPGATLDALEIGALGRGFSTPDPRAGGLVECEEDCTVDIPMTEPGDYRVLITARQAPMAWTNKPFLVAFLANGKGPSEAIDERLIEVEVPVNVSTDGSVELQFKTTSAIGIRDIRLLKKK